MSTIVAENLKRASEAVARSLRGVAAAWANFNGTGTVAIRDSQNVSSIIDAGTGLHDVVFTSAATADDYVPLRCDASWGIGYTLSRNASQFRTVTLGNTFTLIDSPFTDVGVLGDLA